MALFTTELNELADRIGRSNLTVRLHTAAPTNGSPTNARVTAGGGTYGTGATVTAANISTATNGTSRSQRTSTSARRRLRLEP